jgi:hypothetical protein
MKRKSRGAKFVSYTTLLVMLSVLMAVIGLVAAARGEMEWWPGIFFSICAAVIGLDYFEMSAYVEKVEVSDWGIRRTFGPRFRKARMEEVAWSDITMVEVQTTDKGPAVEDMFFMLHGADDKGVIVANSLAVENNLVAQLQARLPGFDNLALVKASGSTQNNWILLWQATRK